MPLVGLFLRRQHDSTAFFSNQFKSRPTLHLPSLPRGYVNLINLRAERLARKADVLELHRDMKRSMSMLAGVTRQINSGLRPTLISEAHKVQHSILAPYVERDVCGVPVVARASRMPNTYSNDYFIQANPDSLISRGCSSKFQHDPTWRLGHSAYSARNKDQQREDATTNGSDILTRCLCISELKHAK